MQPHTHDLFNQKEDSFLADNKSQALTTPLTRVWGLLDSVPVQIQYRISPSLDID